MADKKKPPRKDIPKREGRVGRVEKTPDEYKARRLPGKPAKRLPPEPPKRKKPDTPKK